MPMRVTITLVGFSGCGKSTLGALLARKNRAPFFDTDVLVAQRAGRAIPEMLRREPPYPPNLCSRTRSRGGGEEAVVPSGGKDSHRGMTQTSPFAGKTGLDLVATGLGAWLAISLL